MWCPACRIFLILKRWPFTRSSRKKLSLAVSYRISWHYIAFPLEKSFSLLLWIKNSDVWMMFLRKSFSDAWCFTASGARDVTMLLCHLADESDGGGHHQTKPYLPNCPPGTNDGNREITREQGWVVSLEQFDIIICWLKGLLAHFWSSLIVKLVGHYSHFIFDTGAEKKTWTYKSYRWDLAVPLLIAWHYYLWHCRDHRGFGSKYGATKLPGSMTPLSDPSSAFESAKQENASALEVIFLERPIFFI